MILPDSPGPVEDKDNTPPPEQNGVKKPCGCGHEHESPAEEGVDTANDFMRKFLKKSD